MVLFPITRTVFAQTADEIQEDINELEKQKQQTAAEIEALNQSIKDSESQINGLGEGLPKLNAELEKIDKELELTQKKLQQLEEENKLKELEKKKAIEEQRGALNSSYHSWRLKNSNILQQVNFTDTRMAGMSSYLSEKVLELSQDDIRILIADIATLENSISDNNNLVSQLNSTKEEVARKKKELEDQIAYYNSVIAGANNSITGLKSQQETFQNTISALRAEQQAAAEKQNEQVNNPGNGGSGGNPYEEPENPGEATFALTSRGRNAMQGHGVGMSQWGAYGMGRNGYNADGILTFYYTGVTIASGYENRTVNVDGYGSRNVEDYVAGQGEVPGRACGTAEQVASRPDKYVVDNPNTSWDCWPEEAIKAQAIAYRTYGIYHGGFLYNDARSQVYNGGNFTRWAADETRGKVILHNGQIIEALYSSDNSQGYGTANNDTIFQNVFGDGTVVPYLRAVNDYGIAASTNYTDAFCTTNRYPYSALTDMLNYIAYESPYYTQDVKNVAGQASSTVGQVTSLTFHRDPSMRVKKVTFTGTNGSYTIGGWWFMDFWIDWIYGKNIYRSSGECFGITRDYVYSQTLFID